MSTGSEDRSRLAGRVALVAGGGLSGPEPNIGHAICVSLARAGARVSVADLSLSAATGTTTAIQAMGGEAYAIRSDVTREDDCKLAVFETSRHMGRLDIVVNNVGIDGPASELENTDVTEWDRVLDGNLKSAMLMAKHAFPSMRQGGAIVNVSSIAAARPARGLAYPVAKGAVEALTRALAVNAAHRGIRANCVAPGHVWTPMVARRVPPQELAFVREAFRQATLMKTEGTVWDVADAVVFLSSARWINGQVITVDGGGGLLRQTVVPQLET
jgi:NAD(P)-dependent dehydrogenase (short-subunit alcohol dehydrogenase family)